MSQKLRAKFSCLSIEDQGYGDEVKLNAVYASEGNEENNQFSEATPSGSLEMMVSNPIAKGFFEVGKEYYLDFSKAD